MSLLNLNILYRTALALCKHAGFDSGVSMKRKRFTAAPPPDTRPSHKKRRIERKISSSKRAESIWALMEELL